MIKYLFILILLVEVKVLGQFFPGFSTTNIANFENPTCLVLDHDQSIFVTERKGKVYRIIGTAKEEILDISEEVCNEGDYGLMSIALDPNFSSNGKFYLYYIVDRHYLMHFGKPTYQATANETGATIGRVTRFQLNPADGFSTVLPNSKTILFGETKKTGLPITGWTHGGGHLKFAKDGSLFLSLGDGLDWRDFENQALQDSIITQWEFDNTKYWRGQIDESFATKILRLDPSNGNGMPSNPFYDASQPRSAKSRLYARGARNPFRFTFIPSEVYGGNSQIERILFSDVGSSDFEELNIIDSPNQNFGWPYWEGVDRVNDTNMPFPNSYPLSNPKFPILEYAHKYENKARIRVNNQYVTHQNSPFSFSDFHGGAVIGGEFYTGTLYPEAFRNAYFFSDYGSNWTKALKLNPTTLQPEGLTTLLDSLANIRAMSMAYNHHDQKMYFVNFVDGFVKRLDYSNQPVGQPVAEFTTNRNFGSSPLQVWFDATTSYDPNYQDITNYQWTFGDGTTASGISVQKTFTSTGTNPISARLTVTNQSGISNSVTKNIYVNNTPPKIDFISIDHLDKIQASGVKSIPFTFQISDQEDPVSSLTYTLVGELHHNTHFHTDNSIQIVNNRINIPPIICDNNLYFFKLIFTVTDSKGLSTVYTKNIFPNCTNSITSPPENPNLRAQNFTNTSFDLIWTNTYSQIKSIEIRKDGQTIRFFTNPVNSFKFINNKGILTLKESFFEVIVRDQDGNIGQSSIYVTHPLRTCSVQQSIFLSDLNELSSTNGWGPIEKDKSNGDLYANDGITLSINGQTFAKGLGVHAHSEIVYDISGLNATNFSAYLGIDDEVPIENPGGVIYKIYGDNELKFISPFLTNSNNIYHCLINVEGVKTLKLVVENGGNREFWDHANWADAKLQVYQCSIDNLAPTSPNLTKNSSTLNWSASADNLVMNRYEIINGPQKIGTTLPTTLTYSLSNSNSYYHVQAVDKSGNISISNRVNYTPCPSTRNLDVLILENQHKFQVQNNIQATAKLKDQANVEFNAGKSVTLLPGFSAENGTLFKAQISGCNH